MTFLFSFQPHNYSIQRKVVHKCIWTVRARWIFCQCTSFLQVFHIVIKNSWQIMFQSSLYLLLVLAGFLCPVCDKSVLSVLCVCVVSPDCVRTHCTNLLLNDVATIFVCVPLIVSVMGQCVCHVIVYARERAQTRASVWHLFAFMFAQRTARFCVWVHAHISAHRRESDLLKDTKMGSLVCRQCKACVASWLAGRLAGWLTIPWGQADLRFDYKPNNVSFIFEMWTALITRLDKWFS